MEAGSCCRQGSCRQGLRRQGSCRQGSCRQGGCRQGGCRQGGCRKGRRRQGRIRQGCSRQVTTAGSPGPGGGKGAPSASVPRQVHVPGRHIADNWRLHGRVLHIVFGKRLEAVALGVLFRDIHAEPHPILDEVSAKKVYGFRIV